MRQRSTSEPTSVDDLTALRAEAESIPVRADELLAGGATGAQVAAVISERVDSLLLALFERALAELEPSERSMVSRNAAIVAVGGSGRGELAPHSDADLLLLYRSPAGEAFSDCAASLVRDCWDVGIRLGHSLRTLPQTIAIAREEAEVATSLVEARLLWGSEELFERLRRSFHRRVVRGRKRAFIDACVASRLGERVRFGSTVQRLEPDVKRSLGGLRDVHLIRWIGFAQYGTPDIDRLRLAGGLGRADTRALRAAAEFLTKVRIELHLGAGRCQDVLSREEQLRLAQRRGIEGTPALRPVERLMQEYFRHSGTIANLAQRFVAMNQPETLLSRTKRFLVTHRLNGTYLVGAEFIDVPARRREESCSTLESVLRLYHTAALYDVVPAPPLIESIKKAVDRWEPGTTSAGAESFLGILGRPGPLGAILRSLFDTGVLDRVLPEFSHARSLLQFNQYHSYTVDEHTLRAVEAAAALAEDEGPLGTAYRAIHHQELLHLALLLHDLGKGFEDDHSEVGRSIAERVADRLGLPAEQRDVLVYLVHRHLAMAHLAFRRDIADPEVLLPFAREVGSTETLRMLYVLTAADLTAVGPGVWTDWKAELLTELFERAMLILSGKPYLYHERERLERVKRGVLEELEAGETDGDSERLAEWIDRELDAFPPHYLSGTPPERIAADLRIVRRLRPGGLEIDGEYDDETGTVEYRVIARGDVADGLFYRATGALTAKRSEILAADISTSLDGVVVDRFRVRDKDFADAVPESRIVEVAEAIRTILTGDVDIERTFRRYRRFAFDDGGDPLSDLPMRVVVDNDSSERCTVIDVFAHDRRGLLYTIARAIYELGLSVALAKIATHLDQVVDVFYVTDAEGEKIVDAERLSAVRATLEERIAEFERDGHLQFTA